MEAKNITRVFLLIAMVSSLLALTASAQTAANSALSLINLRVSPQPVVAGDNVTIQFQLYNSYSSSLQNVNLQLTASNPIINVSPAGQQIVSAVGTGTYGSGIQGQGDFVYTLHIPSTLHAGEYTFDIVANYEASPGGTQTLPSESIMPISIYIYGTPSIKLTANPLTAITPGQSESIPISAINTGTDSALNVTMTLHNSNNFKISGTQIFSLGTINASQTATAVADIQPSLNLVNGTYPINATISYTTASDMQVTKNVSILLSALINSPNIVTSIVSASPTNLYAGGNQTLQIEVQNIGLGTAKNITAKFLNGPGLEVGSISQFYISSLSPKNSTIESVYINANKSTINSTLTLPVQLKYDSSNYGGNFSNIEYLPINIQKSAVFNITSVTGTLHASDAYKPITFVIKNIGNEPAQQVTLSLQTTFPITPVNPNLYITSLAPGQSTNATFYVGVDSSGNAGSYPITLFEQWRQPNGAVSEQFSGSNGYYATVSSSGGTGNLIEYGIIAVVIIVAIVFIMRRRKKSAVSKKTETASDSAEKNKKK